MGATPAKGMSLAGRGGEVMTEERFIELIDAAYPHIDSDLLNHLAMYLGGNRESFLDFIGVEF